MRPSAKFIAILTAILVLAVADGVSVLQPAGIAAREPETLQQGQNAIARLAIDEDFNPLAGAYSYDLFLNGVRLGKASLEVKKTGDDFILKVAARTRSVFNSVYRYRGHAVMSPKPVQPSEAVIEEKKGSKTKTFLLKFPEPNRASAVQIEAGPGKEPKQTHQEFSSESFVLDPFSTVFLIRSLDWRVGDVQVFDILTGKKQYELQLTCRGDTVLDVSGQQREAWEIVAQTRSLEPPRKIKLSGFVISLAKDSHREILKVTGRHKIGRIVVDMRKIERQEEE